MPSAKRSLGTTRCVVTPETEGAAKAGLAEGTNAEAGGQIAGWMDG